jgi:dephospho-CoA kinase
MIKIFLFAPMGAGKDEAAAYLSRNHRFVSIALADGIRRYIKSCNPAYIDKSNRALEIDVGEKHREWFGADYWCRVAEKHLKIRAGMFSGAAGALIRDGRFAHEYEYFVNQRGYISVKIVASDEIRKERILKRDGLLNLDQFENPRDCEIIDWRADYVIRNDGEIEDLYAQLDDMVDAIEKGVAA